MNNATFTPKDKELSLKRQATKKKTDKSEKMKADKRVYFRWPKFDGQL